MSAKPVTNSDIVHFRAVYDRLLGETAKAERDADYDTAAQLNYEIAGLIQSLLSKLAAAQSSPDSVKIDKGTVAWLERESRGRLLRAITEKSLQNVHFGDLAVSVANEKRIEDDLRALNAAPSSKSASGAGSSGFAGDADVEDENDETIDLRESGGLYEITSTENAPGVDDLIGYEDEARQFVTLCYTIEDTSSAAASSGNKKATRAILLYGPPGTGKTTTALAVAKTLDMVYVFGRASNLVSVYAGQTQKNLTKLYRRCRMIARRYKKNVLLLLDEIDGLIKNRAGKQPLSGEEYNRITTFLQILEPNDNVDNSMIVSAFTTNRLENVDAAVVQRCATLFLGYVVKPDDRAKLLAKMFSETLTTPALFPWSALGDQCAQLVPRDLVRISGTLSEMRIRDQTQGRRIDQLADKGSLVVKIRFEKLAPERLREVLLRAEPATPVTDYFTLYNPPRSHDLSWLEYNASRLNVPAIMKTEYERAAGKTTTT